MAKKQGTRSGVNKSDAVRAYLDQDPSAGPNAVVAALKEQGIEVSKSLVNALKAKAKAGKTPRTTAAPRRASVPQTAVSRTTANAAAKLSAADLLEAKKLVDQLGGIEQTRQALETLEHLR